MALPPGVLKVTTIKKNIIIMNTIIKLFSLVFIGLLLSCSNETYDNENTGNQGFLTIGDQTVNLSQAYLENYGKKGSSYNIDFSARSETLSGSKGATAAVYFELFSSQEKNLAKGDYNLSDYSSAAPNTFTQWGQSLLGTNITSTDKGLAVANGVSIKPLEGIFTVVENGKLYKVNFSGKGTASYYTNGKLTSTQDNVSFSMEYKGNVDRYNSTEFTAKKVSAKERPLKLNTILF